MPYIEVKMDWQGPRAARNMLSAMQDGIREGGDFLAHQTRANIDTQGPPASTPGDFPHRESGDLQDGIKVVERRAQRQVSVISTAAHSAFVEAARPFLRRTYLENKGRLRHVVLARAKARYGHFRLGN